MVNLQHSFTHLLNNGTHTPFGDTHSHLWRLHTTMCKLTRKQKFSISYWAKSLLRAQALMQIVNSDLRIAGWGPEAEQGQSSCRRAVCTELLGYMDIPLPNTGTHPALPTCCQTPRTVSTAGKRSHATFPFSDGQKVFNFIFNQYTYWLVLSTDIPEILSATEAKKCQIPLFLEVFPNPREKFKGNNFIW